MSPRPQAEMSPSDVPKTLSEGARWQLDRDAPGFGPPHPGWLDRQGSARLDADCSTVEAPGWHRSWVLYELGDKTGVCWEFLVKPSSRGSGAGDPWGPLLGLHPHPCCWKAHLVFAVCPCGWPIFWLPMSHTSTSAASGETSSAGEPCLGRTCRFLWVQATRPSPCCRAGALLSVPPSWAL